MATKKVKKTALPITVRVGPLDYEIIMSDGVNDDSVYDGLHNYEDAKIFIKKHLNENVERVTLIHEILHAIFDSASIPNTGKNHQIIEILSASLYSLIRDNPNLMNYLEKK